MIKKQIYTQRILSSKSLLTHHSSHGHNCSHLWSIETLHTARWKLHLPSLKILHWYIEPFVKYCWFATPYFFFWHPVIFLFWCLMQEEMFQLGVQIHGLTYGGWHQTLIDLTSFCLFLYSLGSSPVLGMLNWVGSTLTPWPADFSSPSCTHFK